MCNGGDGQGDNTRLPPLDGLPLVTDYYFSNFKEVQTNAFANVRFLTNQSIGIHLMNISGIHFEAFSASLVIPNNSNLSIYIIHPTKTVGLTMAMHAFNNIKIDRLHFVNIKDFNGSSIFNTHAFGANTYINELVFEHSNLSGFTSVIGLEQPDVENLYIRNAPLLTNLTTSGLPAFLGSAKKLEISKTGLEYIDTQVFQGWYYVFQELIIKDNPNLKHLPDMVSGFLDLLTKYDLSNNAITTLDPNYDWSPYYVVEQLILKKQPKLELFIQTDILKSTNHIKVIDFSEGIISEDDERLILDHVPGMSDLAAINISYTNFTANMVVDLLKIISNSANQTIQVSLLNHKLNDTDFCSYFHIFQQAPNLLRLELDEGHECNCIVDLFYDEEHMGIILNDTLMQPSCLLNSSRARCDIQSQLSLSQCSLGRPNPRPGYGDIGTIAFVGTMVGLTSVLIVLLALGSRAVYRARQARRPTILDMEYPVATTVDQPIETSPTVSIEVEINASANDPTSDNVEVNVDTNNPTSDNVEVNVDANNPTSDNVEEPLHNSN
jgi:hypothetical protein